MRNKNAKRSGLTLVFVITLIVLFTLAGTAFLVVATNYQKTARKSARAKIYYQNPVQVHDRAARMLLTGSLDRDVTIAPHSLLADVYNPAEGFKGSIFLQLPSTPTVVTTNIPDSGNNFFTILVKNPVNLGAQLNDSSQAKVLLTAPGAYVGCNLTFTSGPARNFTGRIIGYDVLGQEDVDGDSVNDNCYRFIVAIEANAGAASSFPPTVPVALFNNATVLVNGRPFSGTGAGFQGVGLNLLMDALKPNRTRNPNALNYFRGGINEDYDVADYQNMYLAALLQDNVGNLKVSPSFLNPALLNYLNNIDPAVNPQANNPLDGMLTPFHIEGDVANSTATAAFPGLQFQAGVKSNGAPALRTNDSATLPSNVRLQQAIWPVDNDGDGVGDSVWVDIGLPVQTAPDGTKYKVLVSYLVLDMDGRLNLNAHSSLWHSDNAFQNNLTFQNVPGWDDATMTPALKSSVNFTFRGSGFGPGEINLRHLFSNTQHQRLIQGRNGPDNYPGIADGVTWPTMDIWSSVQHFQHPLNYQNSRSLLHGDLSAFGSPPDIHGRFNVLVSQEGNPMRELPGAVSDMGDHPYQIDLISRATVGANTGVDTPYRAEELEPLLRPFDKDNQAGGDRLINVLNEVNRSQYLNLGRLVTTDSFDVPAPAMSAYGDVNFAAVQPTAFTNLVFVRVGGNSALYQQLAAFNPNTGYVISLDLASGEKFDLNRPFGNGRDDNNNGLVDEASPDPNLSESALAEQTLAGMSIDHDNDGVIGAGTDGDAWRAREYYARQLYMTAMLLVGPGGGGNPRASFDADGDGNRTEDEVALELAQWAINVVDFRDQDSIMTRFEADLNPFNGWGTANEMVVLWGCERPELLLTEAVGWHDRRTEDLNIDNETTDAVDPDEDFDQRLRPQDYAFIEVYAPWNYSDFSTNGPHSRPTSDLYTYQANNVFLDLRRVNTYNHPVWRLAVSGEDPVQMTSDPDHPIPANRNGADDYDRLVYFVDETRVKDGTVYLPGDDRIYCMPDDAFNNSEPLSAQKRYGLIGSAGKARSYNGNDVYQSMIGRLTGAVEGDDASLMVDTTRSITLVPGQGVQVINNGPTHTDANIVPSVALPIGIGVYYTTPGDPTTAITYPDNFNVSDPIRKDGQNGYDVLAGTPPTLAANSDEAIYPSAIDQPLDRQRTDAFADELQDNRSINNFRVIHLQRLANPLAAFDVNMNPYLTVDTTSIDIVSFNGVDSSEPTNNSGTDTRFETFERGSEEQRGSFGKDRSLKLWSIEPPKPNPTSNGGDTDPTHIFQFNLAHSVSRLNLAYSQRPQNTEITPPWFNWTNRPFVNNLELMQVPASRPSRLLHEFSIAGEAGFLNPGVTPYDELPAAASPPNMSDARIRRLEMRHPYFRHLLNFFSTKSTPNGLSPNLYRVLEFTHTKSPFAHTDIMLNPGIFRNNNAATAFRHPPFNFISRMREPGKINLNTLIGSPVWDGLVGDIYGRTSGAMPDGTLIQNYVPASYQELVESRRGYAAGHSGAWNLNASFPTMFLRPFRGPNNSKMVPNIPGLEQADINHTLLRKNDANDQPLLNRPSTANTWKETQRNSAMRSDTLSRLGNLTTTRSNVFAVWMTTGQFALVEQQYDSNGNGNADPTDSVKQLIGGELGAATGNVTRNRSFMIIDRSIPVGFEPGQLHNADKTIVLKRFIE